MKSFLNYTKNRVLYNLLRLGFVFLCVFFISKCDAKAFTIDLYSFTYGGRLGDMNSSCSYKTYTTTLSSNFSQQMPLLANATYCGGSYNGKSLAMNLTETVKAGNYYKIIQVLKFDGSVEVVPSSFTSTGNSTSCGIRSGSWDMTACEDYTVSTTAPVEGLLTVTITFKSKVNGNGITFGYGDLSENSNLFYPVLNGGSFFLYDLQITTSTDPLIAIQEQTNQKLDETNNKLEYLKEQNKEAEETRKGIWQTIKDLPNMFLDMLKKLFIPSDDFFETFINDFMDTLEHTLGFLVYPFELFGDIVNRFLDIPNGDGIIHIPQINDPFYNQPLIQEQDFNIGEIFKTGSIGELYDIYLLFVDFMIIIALVNLAKHKFEETFGGGD